MQAMQCSLWDDAAGILPVDEQLRVALGAPVGKTNDTVPMGEIKSVYRQFVHDAPDREGTEFWESVQEHFSRVVQAPDLASAAKVIQWWDWHSDQPEAVARKVARQIRGALRRYLKEVGHDSQS